MLAAHRGVTLKEVARTHIRNSVETDGLLEAKELSMQPRGRAYRVAGAENRRGLFVAESLPQEHGGIRGACYAAWPPAICVPVPMACS
jgi:hypothetical protein